MTTSGGSRPALPAGAHGRSTRQEQDSADSLAGLAAAQVLIEADPAASTILAGA